MMIPIPFSFETYGDLALPFLKEALTDNLKSRTSIKDRIGMKFSTAASQLGAGKTLKLAEKVEKSTSFQELSSVVGIAAKDPHFSFLSTLNTILQAKKITKENYDSKDDVTTQVLGKAVATLIDFADHPNSEQAAIRQLKSCFEALRKIEERGKIVGEHSITAIQRIELQKAISEYNSYASLMSERHPDKKRRSALSEEYKGKMEKVEGLQKVASSLSSHSEYIDKLFVYELLSPYSSTPAKATKKLKEFFHTLFTQLGFEKPSTFNQFATIFNIQDKSSDAEQGALPPPNMLSAYLQKWSNAYEKNDLPALTALIDEAIDRNITRNIDLIANDQEKKDRFIARVQGRVTPQESAPEVNELLGTLARAQETAHKVVASIQTQALSTARQAEEVYEVLTVAPTPTTPAPSTSMKLGGKR